MEAIFEILVMSVMKSADVNFFLEIFEKMYMMVDASAIFCGCSIKNNDPRCNFALPYLERALKSPVKTGLNWATSGPFTDIPA